MRKIANLRHRISNASRRQVTFTLSSILIASVFLVAITMILTGKYRPFASESGTGTTISSVPRLTVPPGSLSYSDTSAIQGSTQSNSLEFTLGNAPTWNVPLQALPKKSSTESLTITGKLKVNADSGGTLTSQPVDWTSTEYADSTKRKINIEDETLLNKIDDLPTNYNLKFTVKPKYYLAVDVSGITNVDQPVNFPEAKAGDLNDDNKVTVADFAALAADLEKPVSTTNSYKDINRNGRIGPDDAAAMAANVGKTGSQF